MYDPLILTLAALLNTGVFFLGECKIQRYKDRYDCKSSTIWDHYTPVGFFIYKRIF
jgi:hypothetical protein